MTSFAIDISKTPFSTSTCWLSLVHDPARHGLELHHARKRFKDEAYLITFQRGGVTQAVTVSATPGQVTVAGVGGGRAVLTFSPAGRLWVEAEALDVHFALKLRFGYGTPEGPGRFKVISNSDNTTVGFIVEQGAGVLGGPDDQPGFAVGPRPSRCQRCDLLVSGPQVAVELELGQIESAPLRPDPGIAVAAAGADLLAGWSQVAARMPRIAASHREAALLAWYTLWSATVPAEGHYRCPSVLMSKKFMCSVWSWDHCFNALALSEADPVLALQQWEAPFHLQSPSGVLPDMWNPNEEVSFGVTKPPIHGWALLKLDQRSRLPQDRLPWIYERLAAWTRWWLTWRDADGDGFPEYPMGCDSGWDNSSAFDGDFFTSTPDLPAFLWLQMDCLAELARRLGDPQAAAAWTTRGKALWTAYHAQAWNGRAYTLRSSHGSWTDAAPTTLLALMPLVLGERLDPEVRATLIDTLKTRHLSRWGLATEALDSPKYDPDGYWRGPIWAPPTHLIADGLLRAGETALAAEIARRFCALCAEAGGNYENFDALTGRGLRAPGYTWTAAVHLDMLRLVHPA
jgi:putative isomerase